MMKEIDTKCCRGTVASVYKEVFVKEITLAMRKILTVKVGDILKFDPPLSATLGEDNRFFTRYTGMKAEVLGFESDPLNALTKSTLSPRQSGGTPIAMTRFFVRFENGESPKFSISNAHFIVL